MDYDGFIQLVQNRRSIRSFKTDPVPDDLVEKIIEAARFAPSGANSQPWEFLVLNDKDVKDRVVEIVKEGSESSYKIGQTRPPDERHPSDNRRWKNPGFKDAPVFIILFGDKRLMETFPLSACLNHGDEIFVSSLASTFLYMNLAVTSLGLASQWVTSTSQPLAQALIKELLGVPRDYKLYDTMAVGYGKHPPLPRLVRKREEITHDNRYDMNKYRPDEQLKKFIGAVQKGRSTMPDSSG
ncbi:MAG: nitroreductase family protein [Desulfobacterales bacterium]|nr:nitroreductase family protein [Desulfobacterales bacterium]